MRERYIEPVQQIFLMQPECGQGELEIVVPPNFSPNMETVADQLKANARNLHNTQYHEGNPDVCDISFVQTE